MPSVRGIVVVLTGLLLAGCMQSGPVFDANFTARDRQQLTNPPYQQAWIAPAYRRQVVDYHRKESPGSILVDTDARYVYYVLPDGKAVRYGAIVGEKDWAWPRLAARKNGRDGRRRKVRSAGSARFRTTSKRCKQSHGGARALPLRRRQRHALSHPRHEPAGMDWTRDFVELHPVDQ